MDSAWEIVSVTELRSGDVIFSEDGLRLVAAAEPDAEGVLLRFRDGTTTRYLAGSTFYRRQGE